MFLNISVRQLFDIWLSLFPTFSHGEHVPPPEAPETLAVPRVPLFPRLFFTGTYAPHQNPVEVAQ